MTTAVTEQAPTVALRCSRPHPRLPGKMCNQKLLVVRVDQVESIVGIPLWCERCHLTTVFD